MSCNISHTKVYFLLLLVSFSAHGTFLGKLRLENKKPTPVQIGNTFRLGASTRSFVIREKPKQAAAGEGEGEDVKEGSFLGVAENVDYDVSCFSLHTIRLYFVFVLFFKRQFLLPLTASIQQYMNCVSCVLSVWLCWRNTSLLGVGLLLPAIS